MQKGELLLHKACHNTTDLSTFNLVLLAAGKALINFTDAVSSYFSVCKSTDGSYYLSEGLWTYSSPRCLCSVAHH